MAKPVVKKVVRSTSVAGRYLDQIVERQMHGFYVAISAKSGRTVTATSNQAKRKVIGTTIK